MLLLVVFSEYYSLLLIRNLQYSRKKKVSFIKGRRGFHLSTDQSECPDDVDSFHIRQPKVQPAGHNDHQIKVVPAIGEVKLSKSTQLQHSLQSKNNSEDLKSEQKVMKPPRLFVMSISCYDCPNPDSYSISVFCYFSRKPQHFQKWSKDVTVLFLHHSFLRFKKFLIHAYKKKNLADITSVNCIFSWCEKCHRKKAKKRSLQKLLDILYLSKAIS